MEHFIGCEAHKKFTVFVALDEKGNASEAWCVEHDRESYRAFLSRLPAHSQIAVEATGTYGWVVDEMERLGHHPKLANPLESKRRMGLTNKTDKLDAKGLAILLRNGTLPQVWIPPAELRDQRELLRLRIFLVRLRTRVKNRIHGTLARYNIQVAGADLFGVEARLRLNERLPELPTHCHDAVRQELVTLDFLETQIELTERRLEAITKVSAEADLLKTLPCVGKILSMVLMLEIGRIDRFPTVAHLASYCGLVPRVRSSGGRTHMGQVCSNVNRNLKCLRGDSESNCHQSKATGRHSRRETVSTNQTSKKPPEGGGRCGAPSGRIGLVGTHQAGGLSGSARCAESSFVDARVSAFMDLAPRG
jgi:transposase